MILSTLGYFKLANVVCLKGRFLLFVPVLRWAYIGLIADTYNDELKICGINLSTWYTSVGILTLVSCVAYYKFPCDVLYLLCLGSCLWYLTVYVIVLFVIYSFTFKHPFIMTGISLLGLYPIIICVAGFKAERKIEDMYIKEINI